MVEKIIILILILTFVILLIGGLVIIINRFLKVKRAVDYTLVNKILCKENACLPPVVDLELPKLAFDNYQKPLARYCADLLARIRMAQDDVNKLVIPKGHELLAKLFNDPTDPLFSTITKTGSTMWIAFRGTKNIREWGNNARYSQKILPQNNQSSVQKQMMFLQGAETPPTVHNGFLKIYEKHRTQIYSLIQDHKPDKIVITGHSLGGAIAILTGVDLKNKGKNVVVYTFASPKVGGGEFSDFVQQKAVRVYRIVNTEDIVPGLPASVSPNFSRPEEPYFYQQCGQAIYFTINGFSIANNHGLFVYIKGVENM